MPKSNNYVYVFAHSGMNLDALADVITEACKDSPFSSFDPNRESLKNLITTYFVKENGGRRVMVLAIEPESDKCVGVVAATVLDEHFLFMDYKMGQEICWWVHKDHRKTAIAANLIEALETWAKMMGLNHLLMGHYENEYSTKMKRMYEKMGYTLKEYNYHKELN